ncbi:hypothetical protein K8Z61_14775 [Nocardioides sp. TRM66260-LWL]|uniref:hypothetical protein n=1 Tax=Nocardioides sp. TRM66260-LWL TaxID=2874478 RepID=UPI001CC72F42|nr:hypothetical protein [Nocardioides sp. TRM66260-LWL]MBZ5735755.1 hypothetical protein [Nocardioides sp. TRM66260-LWL]
MRRISAVLGAVLTLVVAALAALVLPGAAPAPAAAAEQRSCAWTLQIAGDQVNALFPDQAARYWVASIPLPPGGYATLDGTFPHARYLSFNTYTPQTQAIDAIHDAQIRPARGSANPFVAGARRDVAQRAYTVRVVNGQRPARAVPANTLYTANVDGSKRSVLASVALRIYQPDRGRSRTGDAGLPAVATFAADGTPLVAYPSCPDTSLPDLGLTPTIANAGAPAALSAVLGLPSISAPARPRWHKYVNLQTTLADQLTENEALDALNGPLRGQAEERFPSGGFGENVDNKYVYSLVSGDHGPVLVLRGTLPTVPRTIDGQRRMGTGQLRYWSICTNNALTAYYGCLTDDQVPVDARRRYTIVVSTAADRPARATNRCGVAWIPLGPTPQAALLIRNMLPDPGFRQAIQRVRPGAERAGMGRYLPTSRYYASVDAANRALPCR